MGGIADYKVDSSKYIFNICEDDGAYKVVVEPTLINQENAELMS